MSSFSKCIHMEDALSALIKFLIDPLLMKPSYYASSDLRHDEISMQMEAVAWIYNHYLIKESPNLAALDWTALCNKAVIIQSRLMRYMSLSKKSHSDLTLTERKVKDACEKTKALQNSCNALETFSITKVCVCLLNVRKEKCVLVFGGSTLGVWSFIEKSRKVGLVSRKPSDEANASIDSEEALALLAVQEHTGITANVLQVEDCFLIDECMSQGGGRTKFFIMSCYGTFDLSPEIKVEKVAWVPVSAALSSAEGPLVEKTSLGVQTTSSLEYFHLRPFCLLIQTWFERRRLKTGNLEEESHKLDKTQDVKSADRVLSVADADESNNQSKTAPLITVSKSALLPSECTLHQNLEMREQKETEAAGLRSEVLIQPKDKNIFAGLKGEAPKEPKDGTFCAELKGEAPKGSNHESFCAELKGEIPKGSKHESSLKTEFHENIRLSQQKAYTGDSNLALCGPIPREQKGIEAVGLRDVVITQPKDETFAGLKAEAPKEPKYETFCAELKGEAPKESKDESVCAELKGEAPKESKDEKSVCTLNWTEFHEKAMLSQHKAYTGDSNLALCGPIPSPESSIQMRRKHQDHVMNETAALSIQKAAFNIVKKRRKAYSKELIDLVADYQARANQLSSKITECDTDLTLLLGGGKAASQLALQLCMENCEKQRMTSGTNLDQDEKMLSDAPVVSMDKGETSAKKRRLSKDAFRMPRSSMQELSEICIKNGWSLPSYEVLTVQSYQKQNLYNGKVRIRGTNFEISEMGQPSDTVKTAKASAAASMLSTLYSVKARGSML